MKININKIMGNENYLLATVKHLEYSLNDVEDYKELTPDEKKIISSKMFNEIKM
jgi:hypothetical protein